MNKLYKPVFITILSIALFYIIINGLGKTLTPLIISLALTYLFFPIVRKLESKGIKREYAVSSIFILILSSTILLITLLLPNIIFETRMFIKELPSNSSLALEKIHNILNELGFAIDFNRETISKYLMQNIANISKEILPNLTFGLKTSFSNISQWIISILNLFLVPLFFFYIINDYEKIRKEINSFIPESIQEKVSIYLKRSNQILKGYIRGQIIVSIILSILYATGLSIIGLRFGALIGILTGIVSIIPYAGFSCGFAIALTMAFANYNGINLVLAVIAIFIIIQIIEGTIITPKLVGNKVGLSSLATMLALIIGGNLFGITGMLIAIPTAAIIKFVINDLKKIFLSKQQR